MTKLRLSFFRGSRALAVGVVALSPWSPLTLLCAGLFPLRLAHAQQAAPSGAPSAPSHDAPAQPAEASPGAPANEAPAQPLTGATGLPPSEAEAALPPEAAVPPAVPAPAAALSAAPAAPLAPAATASTAPSPPPDEASAEPADAPDRSPFAAGRSRISVLVGSGSTGDDTYLILGAGIGHYILRGLELGVDYEAWLFGDPVLHRLSPEVRYVFAFVPRIQPYVGAFYRHTFVSDFDDLDSVGARGGINFAPRGPLTIGAGAVYERQLSCNESVIDCDSVYPELTLAFSF
jgi:hypothetical protein